MAKNNYTGFALKTIQCQVCGKTFNARIPPSHFKQHNMTPEDYVIRFGSPIDSTRIDTQDISELVDAVNHIMEEGEPKDKSRMALVAAGSMRVFSHALRKAVISAAMGVMKLQFEQFVRYSGKLQQVLDEISAEDRLIFNDEGGPAALNDLIKIAQTLGNHVASSSKNIASMASNVVQDNKSLATSPYGDTQPAFVGTEDGIEKIPESMNAQNREKLRGLVQKMQAVAGYLEAGVELEPLVPNDVPNTKLIEGSVPTIEGVKQQRLERKKIEREERKQQQQQPDMDASE